jgi:hypothetical protein
MEVSMFTRSWWRVGVRAGAIASSVTLAYQTLIWFTAWNRDERVLSLFFLVWHVVYAWCLLRARRQRELTYAGRACAGILGAAMLALFSGIMVWFFWAVLGGGEPPPFLHERIAALEQAISTGAAAQAELAELLGEYEPVRFALRTVAEGALTNTLIAMLIAAFVRPKRTPGTRTKT